MALRTGVSKIEQRRQAGCDRLMASEAERPRIAIGDADRFIKLAGQEIGDDGFEVRPFDLGFAIDGASRVEAVHNEVGRLIGPIGYELR